jgi:hypothetical protein
MQLQLNKVGIQSFGGEISWKALENGRLEG